MNLDHLNDLPDWDDDDELDRIGEEDEEGEGWKPNPTRDACKALYKKWNEIIIMLNGALGTEDDPEPDDGYKRFMLERKNLVFGDAFEVGAKIRSSEAGSMYILRMENAAIIRKNAQYIKISMLGFRAEGLIDETYCKIIRDEIDAFRGLYKEWIATFVKDEYEDEWGLFV